MGLPEVVRSAVAEVVLVGRRGPAEAAYSLSELRPLLAREDLDVVVDGRPEHYFETDREPWASTGFGALEPDLVRRLHRGGRR